MKVAIVGSRGFTNYQLLKKYMDECGLKITAIISGGAAGADSLARRYAKENNIELVEFKADWSQGKGAGYKRNVDIINNSDWVFAFWDHSSKGTKHSIDISKKFKKPIEIIKV